MKALRCLFLWGVLHVMVVLSVYGQEPCLHKLSPQLRRMAVASETGHRHAMRAAASDVREVCAFVRIGADGAAVLRQNGCRELARFGTLYVAAIPVSRLGALSADRRVSRIEARRGAQTLLDSMAVHLHAEPVYEGRRLPQPFTGHGVVMGVMDIGFDLTHPTFFDRTAEHYRITRFWDMLSQDTVGSAFYVGRDYRGAEELLSLGHSRDGLDFTHGTHTLGIAGGSGYDSPYRGMAPESDLCIVANAVNDDAAYIDSADVYKYTFATDALGFKYIFDYADSVGLPCVVSFSEGSGEDFWGYDQLYYEMLDSLTGPGHILVAAAGNQGHVPTRIHKPAGRLSAGNFIRGGGASAMVTMKSAQPFSMRLVAYAEQSDTLVIPLWRVLEQPDSLLADTLFVGDHYYAVDLVGYRSCYQPEENCFDLTIVSSGGRVGRSAEPLSIEVLGTDADVELYRVVGNLITHERNPLLCDAGTTHNIHSPSSAPCVISVGNTAYSTGHVNYRGEQKVSDGGTGGVRTPTSSVGPTYDGRIKPDVMAPGMNIISAYSSYYIEQHPDASDVDWDVAHFDFRGRTYAWNSNSGTSMSAPAVGGAIALWLQAKPDLTPEEAMQAIAATSQHYDEQLSYPNNEYGYGQIDVYRGLLYLLGADKIEGLSAQPTKARLSVNGGQLSLLLDAEATQPSRLCLYDLSGRQVMSVTLPSGQQQYRVPLPRTPTGIYAVQLSGCAALCGSALVRLP